MDCLLEVQETVDVRGIPLLVVSDQILTLRLDGYHTGKYSFDMFTHLRASMDQHGWYDPPLLSWKFLC